MKYERVVSRHRSSPSRSTPTLLDASGGGILAAKTPTRQIGEVRLAGERGRILGLVDIRCDGQVHETVTTWEQATGEIEMRAGGRRLTRGRWEHSRIVEIELDEMLPLPPSLVLQAFAEVEIAFVGARQNPDLLVASHAPAHVLVTAGVRPTPGDPDAPRIARALGEQNEYNALIEVRQALRGCPWVKGIRRATHDEDQRGFDIIVETADAGELYVQVKSSTKAADVYRRSYRLTPSFARTVIVVMAAEKDRGRRVARLAKELRSLYRAMDGKMRVGGPAPPPLPVAPSAQSPAITHVSPATPPPSIVPRRFVRNEDEERGALIARKRALSERLTEAKAKGWAALADETKRALIGLDRELAALNTRRAAEHAAWNAQRSAAFLERFYHAARLMLDEEDFKDLCDAANDDEEED